ncbi:lipid droplet-associated protein [Pseudonocardia phyllosphaerae]|uniref:lipid droplet-associated protein n=1 Tax=Pseudonocardia phyllosphaerae TaxID=3390502 RepID=UPI003978D39D
MSPLPLPVRIAAGLVVTAVEGVRELPRQAVELPVTAVSQALQVTMRVQQTITELAIKGDRALGTLTPAEEIPAWATFDEDLPDLDDPLPPAGFEQAALNGAGYAAEPDGTVARSAAVDGTVATLRPARAGIPVERPAGVSNRAEASASAPTAVPEYPSLSVPQLRGKLRTLSIDDLSDLLAWETAHQNRPPYVTMLTNRIATLSQES